MKKLLAIITSVVLSLSIFTSNIYSVENGTDSQNWANGLYQLDSPNIQTEGQGTIINYLRPYDPSNNVEGCPWFINGEFDKYAYLAWKDSPIMMMSVVTASNESSGQCGDNVFWEFNAETGVLSLSGQGDMWDYSGSNAPWYSLRRDVRKIEFGSEISSIGNNAFEGCWLYDDVIIPGNIKKIGEEAFSYSDCRNVIIENGTETICGGAFLYCDRLTSITLPDSVIVMDSIIHSEYGDFDEGIFDSCKSLTEITLPNNLSTISARMFEYCESLQKIDIPQSVKSIEYGAFYECESIVSMILDDSITLVEPSEENSYYGVFSGCTSLQTVRLPNTLTKIYDYLFYRCSSLSNIELPSGITSIGQSSFSDCTSLSSILLPDGIVSIGESAFNHSELQNIDLPLFVDYIGSTAFYDTNLTSVFIPEGLDNIEDSAFGACDNLVGFTVHDNNVSFFAEDGVLFENTSKGVQIKCYPAGKHGAYTIPSGVSLGEGAFNGCSGLTSITIPGDIKEIPRWAFFNLSNLSSVTLNEGIETINNDSFEQCNLSGDLVIPSTVTYIGNCAFARNNLSSVTFKGDDCDIRCCAFERNHISSVQLPRFLTRFDGFNDNDLTEVKLPETVTTFGCAALMNNTKLTHINLPDRLATIEYRALYQCDNLTEDLVIPSEVKQIDDRALYAGENQNIYFLGNAPQVEKVEMFNGYFSRGSFSTSDTLYYIAGTTGWTDSSNYNSSNNTWNGYKLMQWSGIATKLDILELADNNHYVIVLDDNTGDPISNAEVRVYANEEQYNSGTPKSRYITNEKGYCEIPLSGEYIITVYKGSYQVKKMTYNLELGKYHLFYLAKKAFDNLPYITTMSDIDNHYDYLSQKLYYSQADNKDVNILIEADWGGKTPYEYTLYQEDETGQIIAEITSTTGYFSFCPGAKFKPGYDVLARLKATDGTLSFVQPTGMIIHSSAGKESIDVQIGNLESLSSISLFGPQEGRANYNNNELENMLPASWKLSSDLIPVKVDQKYNPKDGSYTYMVTIGGLIQWDGDEEEWYSIKEWFKHNKPVEDIRKALNKYKNKDEAKIETGFPGLKISSDISGYCEVKYNAFGDMVEQSGGLLFSMEGKIKKNGQFVTHPELYWEVSAAAKASAGLELTFTPIEGLSLNGELKMTVPSVEIGAGAGVADIASVGASVGAEVEVTLVSGHETLSNSGSENNPSQTNNSLGFLHDGTFKIGKFKLKANIFKILKADWTLWKGFEIPLWGKKDSPKPYSIASISDSPVLFSSSEPTYETTDYSLKTSAWNGSSEVLQEWIMPDSTPEIVNIGNKQVMLFITNTGVNSLNDIRLVYSVNNGGIWSKPMPVYEDGTVDVSFSQYTLNDELYIVWHNISTSIENIDETNALEVIGNNSEICYAKWDKSTESFVDAMSLTNDQELDMQPTICAQNDNIVVAWIHSADYNAAIQNSDYNIMYSQISSSGLSEPVIAASLTGFASNLAVNNSNGSVRIAYVDGGRIYYITGNSNPKELSDNSDNFGTKFVGDTLIWQSDGSVYGYSDSESAYLLVDDTVNVGRNYTAVGGNKANAIVWEEVEGDSALLYATIDTVSGWSKPIVLAKTIGKTITGFDVVKDNSGWNIIMETSEDVSEDEEKHSLVFEHMDELNDIEVISASAMEEEHSENTLPISIEVVNNGEKEITLLHIIANGSNVEYDNILDCNLTPGEKKSIVINIDITGIIGQTPVDIIVDSASDTNKENDTASVVIGNADLAVSIDYNNFADTSVISSSAENKGYLPSAAVLYITDSSDNIVDEVELGVIEPNSSVLYILEIKDSDINFENGVAKLSVSVVSEGTDYRMSNNAKTVLLYNDKRSDSHNHVYGEWKFNDTSHWRECNCGDKADLENHSFVNGICAVCGYTQSLNIPHLHTFGIWYYNDIYHWQNCVSCGTSSNFSEHYFIDGICAVCGYIKEVSDEREEVEDVIEIDIPTEGLIINEEEVNIIEP